MKAIKIACAALAASFCGVLSAQTITMAPGDFADYIKMMNVAGYQAYTYDVSQLLPGEDITWHVRLCEHGKQSGMLQRCTFDAPAKYRERDTKLKLLALPEKDGYRFVYLSLDDTSLGFKFEHKLTLKDFYSEEEYYGYFLAPTDTIEVKNWDEGAWSVIATYGSAWNVSDDPNKPFHKCCPCSAEGIKQNSEHYYTLEISPRRMKKSDK